LTSSEAIFSWIAPAKSQTIPGTQPLKMEGDITLQMVRSIDRFLMREIEASLERRQQLLLNGDRRANVDAGRDHVVAGLAHVDVIVGVHLGTELLGREMRDNFVRVHVRARARACLEHVDREMAVVLTVGDLQCGFLHSHRHVAFQQAELRVGAGRRPLDQRQRRDELARHRQAADRKIFHSALRLGAPQGVLRHLEFSHAVVLNAVFFVVHRLDFPV